MKGFILLHRSFLDWEWYKVPSVRIVFEYCLMRANYTDTKIQGIKLKRGQFLTSIPTIAEANGITIQNVRTALKKLEDSGNLTRTTHSKYSIITVVNYNEYQISNSQLTDNQQSANSQLTDNQQSANSQLTTDNKNNTKNKKERNIKERKKFVPPTVEEAKAYISEKHLNVDPVRFVNYYESTGWKRGKTPIKDWKACIRTWASNSNERASPEVGVWF